MNTGTTRGATVNWAAGSPAAPVRVAVVRDGLKKRRQVVRPRGMWGTRTPIATLATKGAMVISGRIVVDITPKTLTTWLPLIFGAATAPTEQIPYFAWFADRVAKVFEYTDCKVNRAVLRGVGGPQGDAEILSLELEVIGCGWSVAPTPPTPFTSFDLDAPYVFCESEFQTPQNTDQKLFNWVLLINNQLNPRYVTGYCGPYDLSEQGRDIVFRATSPYTSVEAAKFSTGLENPTPFTQTARLKFSYTGVSTTFDFGSFQYDTDDPVVNGRSEITLNVGAQAASDTANGEVAITHDDTP